jgi:hypothetical protein
MERFHESENTEDSFEQLRMFSVIVESEPLAIIASSLGVRRRRICCLRCRARRRGSSGHARVDEEAEAKERSEPGICRGFISTTIADVLDTTDFVIGGYPPPAYKKSPDPLTKARARPPKRR